MRTKTGIGLDVFFGIIPALYLAMISCVGLYVYIDFLFGRTSLVTDFNGIYIPIFGFLGCFGLFVSIFRFNLRKTKYIKILLLLLGIFISITLFPPTNYINFPKSLDEVRILSLYSWLYLGPCLIAAKYIYLQLFHKPLEVRP